MRRKIFEEKFQFGDIHSFGVGSYRTRDWVIEKITFVDICNQEITVCFDCIHNEDYDWNT